MKNPSNKKPLHLSKETILRLSTRTGIRTGFLGGGMKAASIGLCPINVQTQNTCDNDCHGGHTVRIVGPDNGPSQVLCGCQGGR